MKPDFEEILEKSFDEKGMELKELTSKPLYAVLEAMKEVWNMAIDEAAKDVKLLEKWETKVTKESILKLKIE